jgi:exodeoxyribonuclease V beta subunit
VKEVGFEPNHFPLRPGVFLLEASAGTGKTFALAHLVLRLVAERGIRLPRMLVVTFTEAAAAELRDRIGRRLQDGLAALEHPQRSAVDPVLCQWRDDMAETIAGGGEGQQPVPLARLRGHLLLALEELDAADITTIHGFCRRTLQRQALEAAVPPGLRLENDPNPLIQQVVHDYWQRQVLPLPVAWLTVLRERRVTPERLRQALLQLDGDPALRLDPLPPELPPERPLAEVLPSLFVDRAGRFEALWQERGHALEHDLRETAAQWRGMAGGKARTTPYSARPRTQRHQEIDAWLALNAPLSDPEIVLTQKHLREYFHPGVFSRVARSLEGDGARASLPQRPLMEAVAALVDGPADLVALHACHWGRAELARRREATGSTGFSQLLERVDAGAMAGAIAERYAVALIDEFQDTDPIQWHILSGAFCRNRHQLVMVGDPKQAIYRFRGGDLATYLRAGKEASGRFSLTANFRATADLIEALNTLMAPGLRRSGLPVPPVRARAGRRGPAGAPIELLWLGQERTAGEALPTRSALEERLPDLVAEHILELLDRDLVLSEGEDPADERGLEVNDIGVLVANHRQAEQIRTALERRGIASRLVSKADVFASAAATALQRFLDAMADPADGGRLRLLAASPLLGWSAAAIAAAMAEQWSALAGRLALAAGRLEERGVLGALSDLLGGEGLARLALGGRMLADLQQVAELVETRLHAARLGPAAVADWLRSLRLDPDRFVPEEHQAHSDSIDGAVSVVTVHRSKGLEYPVVICPYLWQGPGTRRGHADLGVRWHPPGSVLPHLDLHLNREWGQGQAAAHQHRQGEKQERERLAYVALTRAQHLLVLAWGPAAGQGSNPLQPWLYASHGPAGGDDESDLRARSDAGWREALEAEIGERNLALRLITPPPDPSPTRRRHHRGAMLPLDLGPVPRRPLRDGWGRSSYSSWTRGGHGGRLLPSNDEGRDTEDPEQRQDVPQPGEVIWAEHGPLQDFPRGAAAGDCLHRMLERLDYRLESDAAASLAVVQAELGRAGLGGLPPEPLLEGLGQVLRTPCGGALGSFRLGQLEPDHRINEMAFDLCLDRVRASDLAAVFRDHPGGSLGVAYAGRLEALPVDCGGFLTGSIDLVCRAPDAAGRDRWWVVDWKSNWLGRRDGENRPVACGPCHYNQRTMTEVMVSHHYPLQAHLYLVALHRYLLWRLPGYCPERDLGGYLYVFLRGTPGEAGLRALPGAVPGMVVERPPLERVLALHRVLGGVP